MVKASRRSMHRKSKAHRKSKVSRKSKSRKSKASRKGRKSKSRKMRGGAQLSPADVGDSSMMGPSNQMLAQGRDYMAIHAGQHGGSGYQYVNQAPVGDQGLLDASLRAAARVTPLDSATAAASGMSDQAGGGRMFNWKSLRKRFGMGSKKGKGKKGSMFNGLRKMLSMKGKKGKGRKSRKQRGGAYQYANQADYSAPGMLLSSSMEAKALGGMNPEWKLAADPTSFSPK